MWISRHDKNIISFFFSVLHVFLFVTQSQSLFDYFTVLGSSCSPRISLAPSLVISIMDRQDHNFPYFILLHNVQSTLALRTLRYYGHPANADKSQLPPNPPTPGETRKETTETNSRYHGLPLLRKCGHVPAPKRDISLVFSLAIADTYEYFVKNPDSHRSYTAF